MNSPVPPRRCLSRRTRLGLLLLLPLLMGLGGCVNLDPTPDPTRFFTLLPDDWQGDHGHRITVEVSEIPSYARTRRIPLRDGRQEITYLEFARWTGPLDQMLIQRLRDRLDRALGTGGSDTPWRVTLVVLACEGTAGGEAVFGADYSLWRGDDPEPLLTGRALERLSWVPVSGASGLVDRLCDAIDAFALELASASAAP